MATKTGSSGGFRREVFWEFIQNLPLVTGFIAALQLWLQSRQVAAIACMAVSGVAGALNIRVIELRFKGHFEPIRVTIANIVIMPVLMFVFATYLSAGWSSWRTDLLAGMLAGVVLGTIQRLAIKAPIDIVRCIAFACAFPVTLISIRVLVAALPVLLSILISTTLVTLVIVLVGYSLSHISRQSHRELRSNDQ